MAQSVDLPVCVTLPVEPEIVLIINTLLCNTMTPNILYINHRVIDAIYYP